jgi:hypothetical protein
LYQNGFPSALPAYFKGLLIYLSAGRPSKSVHLPNDFQRLRAHRARSRGCRKYRSRTTHGCRISYQARRLQSTARRPQSGHWQASGSARGYPRSPQPLRSLRRDPGVRKMPSLCGYRSPAAGPGARARPGPVPRFPQASSLSCKDLGTHVRRAGEVGSPECNYRETHAHPERGTGLLFRSGPRRRRPCRTPAEGTLFCKSPSERLHRTMQAGSVAQERN